MSIYCFQGRNLVCVIFTAGHAYRLSKEIEVRASNVTIINCFVTER